MVLVAFSWEGKGKSEVQLEPDTIYRIGRKRGLELQCDDETLELAHATIALIADGIVRISAVAGKVHVNGQETEIKSINQADIINGRADLRFGNVKATLSSKADKLDEAAHDSSGFEEETKDKSANTTGDSFIIPETVPPFRLKPFDSSIQDRSANATNNSFNIPETVPPSANTTCDGGDSFNIPETQAVVFNRQSKAQEVSKVALDDDDFLIPETQDVLPAVEQHNPNAAGDDDGSELGTQIRICTQDFNDFDEDAIDDFDSSLLLGDGARTVFGNGDLKQPEDNAGIEQEMSALNWSAANSKCTAVNSTKVDEEDGCLTPDLSAALDDVCTPDLLDFLENNDAIQSSNSSPHELINVTADVHRSSVGNLEKAVNSMETPENTPGELAKDNLDDFIATQAFPLRKSINSVNTQALNRMDVEDNDDFIATQAFPKRKSIGSGNKSQDNLATQAFIRIDVEDNDDFIATQAFPKRKSVGSVAKVQDNLAAQAFNRMDVEDNDDFIATQAFPKRKSVCSVAKVQDNLATQTFNQMDVENNDDFIATQVFPMQTPRKEDNIATQAFVRSNQTDSNTSSPFRLPLPKSKQQQQTPSNSDDLIATQVFFKQPQTSKANTSIVNAEDMLETQVFVSHRAEDQHSCSRLDISDSLSIGDDLDLELKQLIALTAFSSSQSDGEEHFQQSNSKRSSQKKEENKTSQSKQQVNQSGSQETSLGLETNNENTPLVAEKVNRKRSLQPSTELISPPKRMRKERSKTNESLDDKTAAPKTTCTSKLKTEAIVDQAASVNSETKSLPSKKPKSNDEESYPKSKRSEKLKNKEPIKQEGLVKRSKRLATLNSETAVPSKESDDELEKKVMKSNSSTEVSRRSRSKKKTEKSESEPIANNSTTAIHEKSLNESKRAAKLEDSRKPESTTEVSSRSKSRKKTEKSESEPIAVGKTREVTTLISKAESKDAINTKPIDEKSSTARKRAAKLEDSSNPESIAEVPSRSKSKRKPEKLENETTTAAKTRQANTSTPIAKTRDQTKPIDREKSSTAVKEAHSGRRKHHHDQDPLQDINKYIMKIKRSGRKIQLTMSMCNYAELRELLHSLRNEFEVAEDPLRCDVLLMDRGERTYKFLIGIASNKPILSTCWLHDIKEHRSLAVKANHVFKDYKFMELFKFNPLTVMEQPNLLKGLHFILGQEIQPNAKDMQAIIESAGGTVHSKAPPIASNVRLHVVVSPKDKHLCQLLRNYTNAEYIKTEGVMQALVQHKPELLAEHKLSKF